MGLSGSCKSTLVRCFSRLIAPTVGIMRFDGIDMTKASNKELIQLRRHRMGLVYQNMALPFDLQKVAKEEQRVDKVIELVGLEGREGRYTTQLSGGQQRRVGIACSLAVESYRWFLDEPFFALDRRTRKPRQGELLRLQSLMQRTFVFITHDLDEALRLADRFAVMRDGFIGQSDAPLELVKRPVDYDVAEFTGAVRRDRLLSVRKVMEPADETRIVDHQVNATQDLRDVSTLFATQSGPFAVIDEGSALIGKIAAHSLVRAFFCETRGGG